MASLSFERVARGYDVAYGAGSLVSSLHGFCQACAADGGDAVPLRDGECPRCGEIDWREDAVSEAEEEAEESLEEMPLSKLYELMNECDEERKLLLRKFRGRELTPEAREQLTRMDVWHDEARSVYRLRCMEETKREVVSSVIIVTLGDGTMELSGDTGPFTEQIKEASLGAGRPAMWEEGLDTWIVPAGTNLSFLREAAASE